MKLTSRERNLWLGVAVVTLTLLGYRFLNLKPESVIPAANAGVTLTEARRLLHSGANITARHQATEEHLTKLKERYLKENTPEHVRIDLLQKVEDLALASNLKVERKNVIDYPDQLMGVVLEGTSDSKSIFGFMHRAVTAPIGFRLKKIQIHSNLEQKVLKYQLIVVAKIIKGKGDKR